MVHSCLVWLLSLGLSFSLCFAGWNQGFAITSLASGGNVLFVQASSGYLILAKGAVSDFNRSQLPAPRQSFSAGLGWPSQAFTLVIQGKSVVNVGGQLVLAASSSDTLHWRYDLLGRLVSLVDDSCVAVLSAAVSVRLRLSTCSSSPTQQWLFSPSSSPPAKKQVVGGQQHYVTFSGAVSTLQSSSGGASVRLCLGGLSLAPLGGLVLNAAPALAPCSAAASMQQVQAISQTVENGSFPTGLFKLYFPAASACATLYDAGLGLGLGRAAVVLVLADCSLGDAAGGNGGTAFNLFQWNSRGQLQSQLMVDGVEGGTLPLCLAASNGAVVVSDCSFKSLNNRWLFSSTKW